MNNILTILEQAPEEYDKRTLAAIQAETELKKIRAKLSVARSAMTLKHREAKNATIMDALVESEPEVQELVLEEIAKEAEVKIAKNRAQRVENEWISARKISGLREEEVKASQFSSIL